MSVFNINIITISAVVIEAFFFVRTIIMVDFEIGMNYIIRIELRTQTLILVLLNEI